MKVLVFDDAEKHRKAALALLSGHDLTIVSTYDEAEEQLTGDQGFDVALLDLLVPPSSKNLGDAGMDFIIAEEDMGLGSTLALLALKAGIKRIAVVTDMGHHNHPASAAFDAFKNPGEFKIRPFQVGDVTMLCTNSAWLVELFDENTYERISERHLNSPEGAAKYPYVSGVGNTGTVWAKAWDTVLKLLNGEPAKDE